MEKLIKPLIVIGIILAAGGFLYDLFFSGIATPDSGIPVFKIHDQEEATANVIVKAGLYAIAAGIVLSIISRRK